MRKFISFILAIAVLCIGLGMFFLPMLNDHYSVFWLYSGAVMAAIAAYWLWEDFIEPVLVALNVRRHQS